MNAKICDSCNRTIPDGSTYFVHECGKFRVGDNTAESYKYYDLCQSCHDEIVKYILENGELNGGDEKSDCKKIL